MYIKITDTATANNKGSSRNLVHYLEKENRLYFKQHPEYWFNDARWRIEPYEVRNAIDRNVAKLGRVDAKFFLVNISPSEKELRFLKAQFGEAGAKEQLTIYAEKVMDAYAENFKRDGISSAKDLVWFGKVENHRYFTHKDKEVLSRIKKRGERKTGEQMHIQIIVSRKDATNKIKLSPMNTSRGKNQEHSKKLGQFNRVAFKHAGETIFDEMFEFDRTLEETFAYANILKNGDLKKKAQLSALQLGVTRHGQSKPLVNEVARGVTDGVFPSTGDMLQMVRKTVSGFLETLMRLVYLSRPKVSAGEQKENRHKRKGRNQGLGRNR